jgi:hypothetical protein
MNVRMSLDAAELDVGQQKKEMNVMDLDGALAEFVESRTIPSGAAQARSRWAERRLLPELSAKEWTR